MATRTDSNLIIDSFAGYYGGWLSKSATDSSGYYFGTGSQYGPLCIKFKIPSISNFLNRNPTVAFSFQAYGLGYYNTCKFTATVRTSNYLDGSKNAQGAAVSNAIDQSIGISASSFSSSVTTSAITITGSSVKADNSTYYYCWFTNPGGNYQVRYITGKVYYDQYTQCSAPTSVKFEYNGTEKASPYTHPSDNGTSGIKIKWSGAKAGIGMSIKGYTVQQYNKAWKTWETQETLNSSASSGSYLIPEGERGESRTYRVLTIGTVSGYDSSASSSVYIYFNSKPSSPSAAEKLVVSSDTNSTTIPITIPITNESFKTNTRTMKLWWKSSTQSEWTNSGETSRTDGTRVYNFPVNSTPNIGQSRTYQFKMVDNFGDESDAITVTLTRSVSIEIKSFTASLSETSLGKMIVTLKADTEAHKDSVEINLMQGDTKVSTTTIPWKSQVNLLTEGPAYKGSADLTYKFVLKASDDFGKTITKEATNSGISVKALPNTGNVTLYNTLEGNSNIGIIEMGELRFFNKIRAKFGANSLMTSNATLYIGDSSIQYTPTIEAGVFKFVLDEEEILGKLSTSALEGRIDFSFSLGTRIKNSFSKTIYFSPRPSINITPPSYTFEMYNQPIGTFQINGTFSGFGLKDISISGDINGIAPLQYKAENLDPPDTNGYKIEGFNLADLFPLTGFAANARQGTTSKTITLKATNVLGVWQTAQTTVTLDFRKLPSAITISDIKYTGTSLGNTKLCEKTEIQVPFTYTSYGGDAIRFIVYWDEVEKASTTITPKSADTKDGISKVSGSLSFTVPPIPFGKETANIVIKANLVNSSATSSSSQVTPKVSPYEDPGMNVLSSNLNDKILTLNCSLKVQGTGYKYKLQLEGENGIWEQQNAEKETPNSFTLDNSLTSNRVARVLITYTYPTGTTRKGVTIESYSNTFVIFAEGPTVSYRKNYLGINNQSPAEETVIDITTTQGRNKIKFSDGMNATIELDLSKVYNSDNNTFYPAIVVKRGTTEYTLFFD